MAKSKISAGEAYVSIGIRNRIAQGAKGVQSDLDRLGRRVTAMGGIVGGLGLAIGTPFAFAAKKLASFDDAMRSVGAITQSSVQELAMLTATAKELGRTTSFTAEDVASLMIELGRAGFDPTQVNEMTGAVLDLSRATGTEAASAAGILAATIRQYSLAAGDASRVSDALTAAANKSFNSVESLGEALSYAGPEAASFGVSLEETLAILGTLGNIGIQGSSAGTALRRLLTITGAEAKKLKTIFGVEFVDAAGNARPLIDTLGEVAEATNGLGTAARSSKFNEAFGLLGITAAGALGKATTSTKDLLAAIQESGGLANKTATEMDAGLGGSFRKISSAAEGAVIAIGESFGPSLQSITDALTMSIGGFTAWIGENKSLVAALAGTSAALVGTGAGLIALGVTSQLVAAGMGTLATGASVVIGAFRLVSVSIAAAKAVTLVTAGVFAATSSASSAFAVSIALVNAAYSISPLAAGLAVSAWSSVGAVLVALSAPSTLAATMAGVVGSAWTLAGGLAASAWSIITAPIIPFIAAGTAMVAAVGLIAAGLGALAIASVDFTAVVDKMKSMLSGVVSVVSEVFDAVRAALGSGDYAMAAKALWIGVQLAFWEGVSGAMDAFTFLWSEAIKTGKRFFASMIGIAVKAMASIKNAILNPFKAVSELQRGLGELLGSATSFDVDARANAARTELKAMQAMLKIQKERQDADDAPEKTKEEKLQDLTDQRRAGAITDEEFNAGKEKLEESDAYLEKVRAIELEILALEKGEDAAERARLADEKFTETQINQIQVLKDKKKALEEAQEAAKNEQQKRVDGIFGRAQQLDEAGISPGEVFKRVMAQIDKDQAEGRLGNDTADAARETARDNLDSRMDDLKQEGKALADAMRTPFEELRSKLADIAKLRDVGAIDGTTADRAVKKANMEFEEAAQRNRQQVNAVDAGLAQERARVGPSGTFSAAAAAIIGSGGSIERESLKAQRETAKNTAEVAKQVKKNNVARFA